PDEGNLRRFNSFFAEDEPRFVYVGKLIENKGVHVLLEALRGVDARAVIVGFGDYRGELEALAPPGTLFTGALEHRHLVDLLSLPDGDRRALGLAARRAVVARWSWPRVAERLLAT